MINFDCEYCGRGQTVTPERAGARISCRYCGGDCTVPAAGGIAGKPVGGPVEGASSSPALASDRFRPPPAQNPYQAPNAPLGSGAPQWSAGAVPPDVNSAATTAIVLAALSWVLCVFLSPIALWQASRASNLALQYGVKPPTTVTVAKVLAGVQLVLFGLMFCLGFVGAIAQG